MGDPVSGSRAAIMTGSMDIAEPDKRLSGIRNCAAWWGTRHFVTLMLALGMANAYTMRTNMSIAIVAMVNHTADRGMSEITSDECPELSPSNTTDSSPEDGPFTWSQKEKSQILASFFIGYVVMQVPFGLMAKKYGAKTLLGYGMLFNSLCAFILPICTTTFGFWGIIVARFLQGLGEGPIVPCSHGLLAKWIPPNERSRMGAIVYSGAQFGTIIAMPISGFLANKEYGGWPNIFYFFGAFSLLWSILFIIFVYEDPNDHPKMDSVEKKYIIDTIWGETTKKSPPIPWKAIATSLPFWAIMLAHIGHNYGYETFMNALPTFMKQILKYDIKSNGVLTSIGYLAMWFFSYASSWTADAFISKGYSRTAVRKIAQVIGHYGPAITLIFIGYSGCNRALTVTLFTVMLMLNGAIYSGFKVSHLDISPRFAGILMAFTNFSANVMGLISLPVYGYLTDKKPTQEAWRGVFFICSAVYIVCNTFFLIFSSNKRQPWDSLEETETPEKNGKNSLTGKKLEETVQ